MLPSRLTRLSVTLLLAGASTSVFAAGYALTEQSVTGLGRAFAGSAAVADDASTIFFNPAGLTQLQGSEVNIGLNYIAPKAEFDDNGSTHASGAPMTGSDGGDGARNAWVPVSYASHRLNDRVVVGLGVGAPFGLVTDYKDDWKGRYQAIKSDLKTININPTIAFSVNDKLSLGLGVNLQYADIELTQAADFGSAFAATALMTTPQSADGRVKLEADDWSWGYNLGLTYDFTPQTRLGLSYRSKITHDLEGDGSFRYPDNPGVESAARGAGFQDADISGRVTLPESASIALHHQLNNQWAIMGDMTYTRWSRFEALRIESPNPNLQSDKTQNWHNTWRVGLGTEYKHDDRWSWRAGVAFDESPVPGPALLTARIPDNDRYWLSLGGSYRYSDNLILDAGYTHIFVKDSRINHTDSPTQLRGDFENQVDIVAVQMRWQFD